jgi:hypothetical protein
MREMEENVVLWSHSCHAVSKGTKRAESTSVLCWHRDGNIAVVRGSACFSVWLHYHGLFP